MIERTPILNFFTHLILFIGFSIAVGPLAIVAIAASHNIADVNKVPMSLIPGSDFWVNMKTAWTTANLGPKLLNSLIFATGVAVGKVLISAITAFSLVYFRYPGRHFIFWLIFITLMLPLEVRIVPTYAVAANVLSPYQGLLDLTGITWLIAKLTGIEVSLNLGLLNSYPGLILPLIATATGTFLYRQFFLTIPDELTEAARMDGAGALRFFIDILMPLSRTNMAALGTIMFLWAWNQYLWPLLVTTDPAHATAVTELKQLIPNIGGLPEWHIAMAGTLIVMLPPLAVVVLMQRWFVRGLIATEK
ncbi:MULTISPECIES: ABC transporter permease subunit [Rhizobium]|uniref:sn-glycerol-3-phosphate transport system permease protein UgpE n=1 Tax=Rhizobium tropici TaxID=398 RepID=A0A6P1C4X6_RHITR|nr:MULTISPECIES: ABC transporter permease subunit [Rhizobium]AGB70957.1 sn-glycerol-3-phosphate ABC transporter, permease protein UgpE [Rhizobium tropici CIAT 899]MBB4242452.1 sn-glycerol 3-phosphate transport system permease protein [Rhizobium tropici]MBB5594095.1 sn-glycerol 3-phosphate transport system permease protein [Rhizobium tropici]MBB6492784.1 sn-glycerol 3-phosphate transport system permease protein [Rhizobium tropici]NEV11757.1 ABC transporter permease subunit [Rhizobium tropici]